jgi:hypothetical protein
MIHMLFFCHFSGELEQEFLEAMSDYYYADKPKLTDEEFELLKEELIWAGSKVAILDGDEQRFLEASQAYQKVRCCAVLILCCGAGAVYGLCSGAVAHDVVQCK